MPRNHKNLERETINTATLKRLSFCLGHLTLSGYDMTVELHQIAGFQFSQNLYKPVIDNFVCPFHIFVMPHQSQRGVFELVNNANTALLDMLSEIGPNSKVKVILLDRNQNTKEVRILLGELLPKLTTEIKTTEVVEKIARYPPLNALLKQALNCRSKTKDGVPQRALKKILGTNSPSLSKMSSVVKQAQREEKWNRSATKLGLPKYSEILSVLTPFTRAIDTINLRLDELDFDSVELRELCQNVASNPSAFGSARLTEAD